MFLDNIVKLKNEGYGMKLEEMIDIYKKQRKKLLYIYSIHSSGRLNELQNSMKPPHVTKSDGELYSKMKNIDPLLFYDFDNVGGSVLPVGLD